MFIKKKNKGFWARMLEAALMEFARKLGGVGLSALLGGLLTLWILLKSLLAIHPIYGNPLPQACSTAQQPGESAGATVNVRPPLGL
jgi:hypothetical protein